MKALLVRLAAAADIEQAHAWYERQRGGLGDELLAEVGTVLAAIRERPDAFAIAYRNTRRALLHRFPYGLFYREMGDTIVVVACFHGRSNPVKWRRR